MKHVASGEVAVLLLAGGQGENTSYVTPVTVVSAVTIVLQGLG